MTDPKYIISEVHPRLVTTAAPPCAVSIEHALSVSDQSLGDTGGGYQIVFTDDDRIRPSRLMTGTPKCMPVAATILSGISGAGHLQHSFHDLAIEWRFLDHIFRVCQRILQIRRRRMRASRFFSTR